MTTVANTTSYHTADFPSNTKSTRRDNDSIDDNGLGSVYGYGIGFRGKYVNTASPVAWQDSLQIWPDTSLPTVPGDSGEGDEPGDNPRDASKAAFTHWASYDTFKKTNIHKAGTLERAVVYAGMGINYLWSDDGRPLLHTILDIGGMIPYVGSVFDVVNAGIYFYEGDYIKAGLNMSTVAVTLATGLPLAKYAATGLKAVGASAKFADKYACPLATAVTKVPYAAAAAFSYMEGRKELEKGNYLGATLNFVSMGTFGLRGVTAGKYCFTEGTQIVVGAEYDADGNFVNYVTQNIEDIKVGDLVYSYDTVTGEVSLREVTATSALKSDHINKLTIVDEDGVEQIIEATDCHPFWVLADDPDFSRGARDYADENGVTWYHEDIEGNEYGYWVEAKDLRVGDVFMGANGELSTLVNIVRVEQEGGIAVFNFTVEGNHNYFILAKEYEYGQTCVLVHNGVPCQVGRETKPKLEPGNLKEGWKHIDARHISGNHPDGPGVLFARGTTQKQIRKLAEELVDKGKRISQPGKRIQVYEKRSTINGMRGHFKVIVDSFDMNRIITIFPIK